MVLWIKKNCLVSFYFSVYHAPVKCLCITNYTRLIYNDITPIKVIMFILVELILTYFCCYLGVGVEIVLFLVRLSFAF